MSPEKQDEKDKVVLPNPEEVQGVTLEEIKQFFPTLFSELIVDKGLPVTSPEVQQALLDSPLPELEFLDEEEEGLDVIPDDPPKLKEKDHLQGFTPSAVDFIRRAKTEEEAWEVLDYLEGRGELVGDEVDVLRKQLTEQGLRSFGEYKKHGYYFAYQQRKHLEEKMRLMRSRKQERVRDESGQVNEG